MNCVARTVGGTETSLHPSDDQQDGGSEHGEGSIRRRTHPPYALD
jgi:hypothetical protein